MTPQILVVDDEKSLRITFEAFLKNEGYAVRTASSFDEAMARIEEKAFDLVFSDILLGGKTGLDLLEAISGMGLILPVVMVTGAPDIKSAAEAVRLGAFAYLAKPVVKDDLLRTAASALKYREAKAQSAEYQANLNAVFESVQEAIITVDRDGLLTHFNESAAEMLQLDSGLLGNPFSCSVPGCRRFCHQSLEKTLKEGEPCEVNRVECLRSGGRKVLSLTTRPLRKRGGEGMGAVMVLRDETRLASLEKRVKRREKFHRMIGSSEVMQGLYSLIDDLADLDTTVLVTGESGTGKELVAEALHELGRRKSKPLVKMNCAGLSDELLESELFGHVRGSFTGAIKDRTGRFQLADGGTLFLDEIGDISPRMQMRLLRVLQEREFERVGDSRPIKVDVRIVAATNQDLKAKVEEGEFRQDLYYRLKVMTLELPPLRERKEDLAQLTEHFIAAQAPAMGKNVEGLSTEAFGALTEHDWPGNLRELQHVIEYALVKCPAGTITTEHLPAEFRAADRSKIPPRKTAESESDQILQALEKSGGNKAKAARLLGIDRKTLYRKMERFDLSFHD